MNRHIYTRSVFQDVRNRWQRILDAAVNLDMTASHEDQCRFCVLSSDCSPCPVDRYFEEFHPETIDNDPYGCGGGLHNQWFEAAMNENVPEVIEVTKLILSTLDEIEAWWFECGCNPAMDQSCDICNETARKVYQSEAEFAVE